MKPVFVYKVIVSIAERAKVAGSDGSRKYVNLMAYFNNLIALKADSATLLNRVNPADVQKVLNDRKNRQDELKIWYKMMLKLREAALEIKNIDENEMRINFTKVLPPLVKIISEYKSTQEIVNHCTSAIQPLVAYIVKCDIQLREKTIAANKSKMGTKSLFNPNGFDKEAHETKYKIWRKFALDLSKILKRCQTAVEKAQEAQQARMDEFEAVKERLVTIILDERKKILKKGMSGRSKQSAQSGSGASDDKEHLEFLTRLDYFVSVQAKTIYELEDEYKSMAESKDEILGKNEGLGVLIRSKEVLLPGSAHESNVGLRKK